MLNVTSLRKVYRMGQQEVVAINGLDLQVKKNEFIAVMGASGSGKSTLMNILGCLDTPTSGSYLLNNKEVSHMDDDELALIRNQHLGFVFQSFNLLPRLSALKNVELPLRYCLSPDGNSTKLAREMLEIVGLKGRADHKPSELSGGEMQRVAIARALINNPDIILADEPTGNLDSNTAKEIMSIMAKLHQQGQTIIMVTHENDIATYAQRTIILKDGRIVTDRTNG
jgi:putative ABC transport system ATP-binding protein